MTININMYMIPICTNVFQSHRQDTLPRYNWTDENGQRVDVDWLVCEVERRVREHDAR